MGIKLSFLGCKTEDEERQNYDHNHRNGDNSTSYMGKIFCLHILFYNALKNIVHKLRCAVLKPRNRADPILPVVDPKSSILNDPLLVETLVISSPDFSSSSGSSPDVEPGPFDPRPCFLDLEEESISSQQWPEENSSNSISHEDHVTVFIPNFRYSLYDTSVTEEIIDSTVIIEEIAPRNVACVEKVKTVDDEEEKEKVVIKNVVVVDVVINEEAKWIKHYCNLHRILLVGEGDFSFSASLAVAFCEASNMVATSLNSIAFLKKNYMTAASNIKKLRNSGCMVMHGIDATEIANHELLGLMTFDRIIFNFPFAGFFDNLSNQSQLRRHRRLVSQFLKNAKEMICEDGEIHITHKTNGWHGEWKLEAVASSHRLRLIEAVDFNHLDYPGYNTKYGFGGDKNFNCNPSKTYKFGLKG